MNWVDDLEVEFLEHAQVVVLRDDLAKLLAAARWAEAAIAYHDSPHYESGPEYKAMNTAFAVYRALRER